MTLTKFMFFIFLAFNFNTALAKETSTCSNFAKYAAIKQYKAETGVVQGSHGIDYAAKLVGQRNNLFDYVVSISDNNEDLEYWTVKYFVRVHSVGPSCQIIFVRKQK